MEISIKDKILSLLNNNKCFKYKSTTLDIEIPIIINTLISTYNFNNTLNLITYRWGNYYTDEMKKIIEEYKIENLINSFKNLNLNNYKILKSKIIKPKLTIKKNKFKKN